MCFVRERNERFLTMFGCHNGEHIFLEHDPIHARDFSYILPLCQLQMRQCTLLQLLIKQHIFVTWIAKIQLPLR